MSNLTQLLERMRRGDAAARDALFAAWYPELKRLARSRLRAGGRNTVLGTTVLVHDSYLRLAHSDPLRIADRKAFFAYAARVMRSVIVDSARQRLARRRGGDAKKTTLSTDLADNICADAEHIVRVHQALEVLEKADERAARVVEMRYFGGYDEAAIAESIGVTERTVRRDWDKAKRLLLAILRSE